MIIWRKCSLSTRAEKEAAAKKQQEQEQLPETVTALKAAQSDTDEMVVDRGIASPCWNWVSPIRTTPITLITPDREEKHYV